MKAGLVLISGVRTLLDLYHFDLFEHFKAMTARGKENHIAVLQNATLQVLLITMKKIYAKSPRLRKRTS